MLHLTACSLLVVHATAHTLGDLRADLCVPYSQAGIDYRDANLTVVPLSKANRSTACCDACASWNERRAPGSPACTIGVWHRDTSCCALKATALKPFKGLHVLAYAAAVQPADPSAMDLVILPNASSVDKGAVCLDGSAPAIYYRKPNTTADPSADKKWVLYFKGGGWCTNAAACAARAHSLIGSSNNLNKSQPTFSFGGPLDADPSMNPAFAHFHHVIFWYCDGGSFSGDRQAPEVVDGQQVWYRGKRNLDAMLAFLQHGYGLNDATEVLLSGGSAGGLSTYLHADYVRSKFDQSVKFKAAPISGFFLNHATVTGEPLYIDEMKWVFETMNSTGGVNSACIGNTPASLRWQCIFANASYAHTATPIFPLNSAVDAWQMGHVFDLDAGRNTTCATNEFDNCTAGDIQGKFQLLSPAPPYYPFPRGKAHTRGNIWSFTVG